MKHKTKYTREFLGTVVSSHNYQEILKEEGADKVKFHNKHLRAYIKGKGMFTHGINSEGNPIHHFVQQNVKVVK